MGAINLVNNLALLVALSVLSGFIRNRYTQRRNEPFLQGLCFGCVTVIGMMHPVVMAPGLIFDGRSVVISLCGLFFGPVAAVIAGMMAIVCRILQGGTGALMGVLVIVSSVLLGIGFYYRQTRQGVDMSVFQFWVFGLLVHVAMLMCTLALPSGMGLTVLGRIALPVMGMYPFATVLIGKVLSDQLVREHFVGALRENQEELRTTLYSIGDGIITADKRGCVRQMNPVAEKYTGWTEAEACGKRCEEVFRVIREETREIVENPVERVLREKKIVGLSNHTLLLGRDGSERPIADNGAPIRDSEGEIKGVVLVFRDQAAERAAQKALKVERDNLRAIMASSPDGVMVFDRNMRIVDANPAAERLFNRVFADVYYRPCGDFLGCFYRHEDPRGCGHTEHCSVCELSIAIQSVFETGQGVHERETEAILEDQGATRNVWFQFSMEPVELDGRGHVIVALHDITARKQSEASLRRLEWMLSQKPEKRTRAEFQPSYGDITQLNREGRILKTVGAEMLANIVSEFLDLLGTSAVVYEANGEYALNLYDSGWCRLLSRASRRLCDTDDNQAALASGRWKCHEDCWSCCAKEVIRRRVPMDMTCSGGLRVYAVPVLANDEVIGAVMFGYGDPPRDPDTLHALSAAYQVDYLELFREANAYDSRPLYIIEMAKGRLHTASKLIGALVETRQAEEGRVKLEGQFRQSQKMEAVGRLAGGVAHDFNNILQSIIGYSELLSEKLPEGGDPHTFACEILSEGKRAAALTRQLLAFARKQSIDPVVFDLNEAVGTTLMMLRRLLGEDIDLCWRPSSEACRVKMDTSQLDQILANLAVNARDAIAGVGRMMIETRNVVFDEAYCAVNPGFTPGQYIMLAVSDDGCGMDRATLDRIFEPFFTTKGQGKGTGLGLATVYGIVKQNHGFIHVYSEVDKGTTFKIYLAEQKDAGVVEGIAEQHMPQPQMGTETVLLVDDEEGLLRSAHRLLERLGYTVLSAGGPVEALKVSASYGGPIHLLLTDVVMPVMSGRNLSQQLLVERPDMKCVFMSGYTANVIAHCHVLEEGVLYLQKPFSKAELATKLREALECVGPARDPLTPVVSLSSHTGGEGDGTEEA